MIGVRKHTVKRQKRFRLALRGKPVWRLFGRELYIAAPQSLRDSGKLALIKASISGYRQRLFCLESEIVLLSQYVRLAQARRLNDSVAIEQESQSLSQLIKRSLVLAQTDLYPQAFRELVLELPAS